MTTTPVDEVLQTIQAQPQVALPAVREKLNNMLADKTIHLTIGVGEQVNIKHAWFTVVRVDYPYIILEFTSVAKGFENQDAKLMVDERFVWKSAYMHVVQITDVYVGIEITGITERLEKKIALGRARKALDDAGRHGGRTGKRRKARARR